MKPHHYQFVVLALDTGLGLAAGARRVRFGVTHQRSRARQGRAGGDLPARLTGHLPVATLPAPVAGSAHGFPCGAVSADRRSRIERVAAVAFSHPPFTAVLASRRACAVWPGQVVAADGGLGEGGDAEDRGGQDVGEHSGDQRPYSRRGCPRRASTAAGATMPRAPMPARQTRGIRCRGPGGTYGTGRRGRLALSRRVLPL
jgi:hypothetical protein